MVRRGFFVVPRRTMGRLLEWFSYLYWGGMAVRYVVSMALHPERRWFGGTIPIFFHCVLATFLFVVGRFHTRLSVIPRERQGSRPTSPSRTTRSRSRVPSSPTWSGAESTLSSSGRPPSRRSQEGRSTVSSWTPEPWGTRSSGGSP